LVDYKQHLYNWLVRNGVRRPVVIRPGPAPVRPPIAIVTAFFGKTPIWAPVFFVTARKNPDVQFFVYTDLDDLDSGGAKNVTLKPLTIADFNRKATEAIGTPIEVQHHLAKMSDLKPAYGMIFADDLKGFAYWAYTDFDVAWGDIRKFLTDELLHAHDIISSRTDRLCGHFTLFRNTPEYNRTYELIPDVIRAMGHYTHFHLDETVLTKYLKKATGKWPLASTARVYWKSDWTIDASRVTARSAPGNCRSSSPRSTRLGSALTSAARMRRWRRSSSSPGGGVSVGRGAGGAGSRSATIARAAAISSGSVARSWSSRSYARSRSIRT